MILPESDVRAKFSLVQTAQLVCLLHCSTFPLLSCVLAKSYSRDIWIVANVNNFSQHLFFSAQVFVHIVIPDLEVLGWCDCISGSAHAFSEPGSVAGWSNLPRLTRVRATHRTSATSAGKMSALLRTFPYLCWKGSIIVTYLFSLIGLAKKKPPGAKKQKQNSNMNKHSIHKMVN